MPSGVYERKKKWREKCPWIVSFRGAKYRCTNKNEVNYHRYGGRGIEFKMTIKDFKFLWFRDKAYLMKRPSIDRIDNKGNYELDNCRFIEQSENSRKDELGEKNHNSKLTEKQIREIRKKYIKGILGFRKLAKIFNVSNPNISLIVTRKRWKHI